MNDTITKIQIKDSTLYHADCMDVFDEIGKVDVVITDPPYGLDKRLSDGGGKHKYAKFRLSYEKEDWDKKISNICLNKLFEISKEQIVFGANYYSMPPTRAIVCWDKGNKLPTFSEWEYIWTSFDIPAKIIACRNVHEKRYHPTQKPIYVMRWIIDKYTKETDVIFDPFMGSGSTGIACVIGGRKFIGIEKEKQYFDIACKRIRWASKQNALF